MHRFSTNLEDEFSEIECKVQEQIKIIEKNLLDPEALHAVKELLKHLNHMQQCFENSVEKWEHSYC